MIEANPHRRTARTLAFIWYIIAGCVAGGGLILLSALALTDVNQVRSGDITKGQLLIVMATMFASIILIIVLLGWRIQRLFGQDRRQEKIVARSLVGCLRLSSIGCASWTIPTVFSLIFGSTLISTGKPATGWDVIAGCSFFAGAIALMLTIAWFISANFVRLNDEERRNAYQTYLNLLKSRLPGMVDPQIRAYMQAQTLHVLTKLDTTLKSTLLEDLSKSNLLNGNTRISLSRLDFRRIDLRLSSLPEADLREINLDDAMLEGVMLSRANLFRAKLKRVNLSHARLQEANLEQADLTEAVLREAKLRGANLAGTVLKKANLTFANLQRANLQGANLRQADLAGAVLTEADLRGADLTKTIVSAEQLQQARL